MIGAGDTEGAGGIPDAFGRKHTYLRIAVTDRCNLRCAYCAPAGGRVPHPGRDLLSFGEIERLVRILSASGVTRVRLTGGEPLARPGLPLLVSGLAAIPGIRSVTLTTNGVLLARDARALRASGLAAVNISLDTLRPERFAWITGSVSHQRVLEGIDAALTAGFPTVKLNVVVMGGINDDELWDFVEFVRFRPLHLRFIEYMPFRANGWSRAECVPVATLLKRLAGRYALRPVEDAAGVHAVSQNFRIEGVAGTVGFIASMSEPFCGSCNRLRLTADGSIKSCLFHPAEVSIRAALRSAARDEEILSLVESALAQKPAAHPPAEQLQEEANRSMIEIGG